MTSCTMDPDYNYHVVKESALKSEAELAAKDAAREKVKAVIRNVIAENFKQEITAKESEVMLATERLREARQLLDRLRSCVVASYYAASFAKPLDKNRGPDPGVAQHPAVQNVLRKAVTSVLMKNVPAEEAGNEVKTRETSLGDQLDSSSVVSMPATEQEAAAEKSDLERKKCEIEEVEQTQLVPASEHMPVLGGRHRVKKQIIVGNVSKYIAPSKREGSDSSTHKWMVYVRGCADEPRIDHFVRKVWFFLHPSYRPNDLVEVSEPPFHLTRRGWGEFPIRVQLHFRDPRNRRVDILHNLHLDRTYTGLQTLGAETVCEVELDPSTIELRVDELLHHVAADDDDEREDADSVLASCDSPKPIVKSQVKAPSPRDVMLSSRKRRRRLDSTHNVASSTALEKSSARLLDFRGENDGDETEMTSLAGVEGEIKAENIIDLPDVEDSTTTSQHRSGEWTGDKIIINVEGSATDECDNDAGGRLDDDVSDASIAKPPSLPARHKSCVEPPLPGKPTTTAVSPAPKAQLVQVITHVGARKRSAHEFPAEPVKCIKLSGGEFALVKRVGEKPTPPGEGQRPPVSGGGGVKRFVVRNVKQGLLLVSDKQKAATSSGLKPAAAQTVISLDQLRGATTTLLNPLAPAAAAGHPVKLESASATTASAGAESTSADHPVKFILATITNEKGNQQLALVTPNRTGPSPTTDETPDQSSSGSDKNGPADGACATSEKPATMSWRDIDNQTPAFSRDTNQPFYKVVAEMIATRGCRDVMRDALPLAARHVTLVSRHRNTNDLPFCADSEAAFLQWNIGKQRAAEWQRAAMILRVLTEVVRMCKLNDDLPSKRAIIRWCLLRGYSVFTDEYEADTAEDETSDATTKLKRARTCFADLLARLRKSRDLRNDSDDDGGDDDEIDVTTVSCLPSTRSLIKLQPQDGASAETTKPQEDCPIRPTDDLLAIDEMTNEANVWMKPVGVGSNDDQVRMPLCQIVLAKSMQLFVEQICRESLAASLTRRDGVKTQRILPGEITVADVANTVASHPALSAVCDL